MLIITKLMTAFIQYLTQPFYIKLHEGYKLHACILEAMVQLICIVVHC